MRVFLGLLVCLTLACERQDQAPEQKAEQVVELDAGALAVSAVEGLEAAAKDPVTAGKLELASALENPDVEVAVERLLARLGADPTLSDVSDRLFAELQEGPAIRSALADYARANPELDLTALTEGFVAYVDERLTRAALAEAIEAELKAELRRADQALARALIIESKGVELLAAAIMLELSHASVRSQLEARLGKDPAALQSALARRLAEPRRVAYLIEGLGEQLRSEAGIAGLVAIVDHEQTAKLLAASLARVLEDAKVRERCEALFGLALAEELDVRAFERELRALLAEPAVVSEAESLLSAMGREEFVRQQIAERVAAMADAPGFGEALVEALG